MDKTLILNLKCMSRQIKGGNVEILTINKEKYIVVKEKEWNDEEYVYQVFEETNIIPDLLDLITKEKNKEKYIKGFVKKWGLLKRERLGEGLTGQKLDSFWYEAMLFNHSWNIYKALINKNDEFLTDEYESLIEFGMELINFANLDKRDWNVMRLLKDTIELYTCNGRVIINGVKHGFEVMYPALYFDNLIDALYMQFLISLTENKKVCPVCNSTFKPERKDKKYCSETCKNTAKTRRYRENKKLEKPE